MYFGTEASQMRSEWMEALGIGMKVILRDIVMSILPQFLVCVHNMPIASSSVPPF